MANLGGAVLREDDDCLVCGEADTVAMMFTDDSVVIPSGVSWCPRGHIVAFEVKEPQGHRYKLLLDVQADGAKDDWIEEDL